MELSLFSKVIRILWSIGPRIDTVGYLLALKYVVSLNGSNTVEINLLKAILQENAVNVTDSCADEGQQTLQPAVHTISRSCCTQSSICVDQLELACVYQGPVVAAFPPILHDEYESVLPLGLLQFGALELQMPFVLTS